QHFIVGLGVATEVDAVDVGTLARVDHEGHVHGAVLLVDLRHAVDVGEGVALVTQTPADQIGGGGHHLTGEHLTRLDQQQTADVLLRYHQVTGQAYVVDRVQLALVDVHGDVDVLLVRGDGYLGGGDIHVDVAAVQVPGTQTLQVAGQLFPGVLVVVADEGEPAGGLSSNRCCSSSSENTELPTTLTCLIEAMEPSSMRIF